MAPFGHGEPMNTENSDSAQQHLLQAIDLCRYRHCRVSSLFHRVSATSWRSSLTELFGRGEGIRVANWESELKTLLPIPRRCRCLALATLFVSQPEMHFRMR